MSVFVTQEMPKLNYLPAEKFGSITFLTRDDFSPVASSLSNAKLLEDIRSKLTKYDPSEDYIVFSGSPTVAAAVFAFLGSICKTIRVLRWSNRDMNYTPITINL